MERWIYVGVAMRTCIICGKEFKPFNPKSKDKTCASKCRKEYRALTKNQSFIMSEKLAKYHWEKNADK